MKKFIIFLSLLFLPLVVSASIDTNLSYGLKDNEEVRELQEFLIGKNFLSGSATGNFYSLTLNAVKNYQISVGLPKSGYVGPLTRKAINEELAKSQTSTPPATPKTNDYLIKSLQDQINLLLQQLALLKTQTSQTPQQQPQQQSQTNTNNTNESTSSLEIISVNIVPDKASAKIEWETDKPTESKIFVSGGTLSSKIFTSVSGLSTRHSATITGLSEETTYSYQIEAIAGGVTSTKKSGSFKTLPPLPLFEFTPLVQIGDSVSTLGHVYFTINENYDSCTWRVGDVISARLWEQPSETKIPPGKTIDITGFSSSKTYAYEFTCLKSGFRANTKTGEFTMPPPQIYTERKSSEFFFWHWGGSQLDESLLNLKIKVTLKNPSSPNELKFYRSGTANLWQTFSNISNGDILETNSFPADYSLLWSYSGSAGDLSLEIIEGSGTKDGQPIIFKL